MGVVGRLLAVCAASKGSGPKLLRSMLHAASPRFLFCCNLTFQPWLLSCFVLPFIGLLFFVTA